MFQLTARAAQECMREPSVLGIKWLGVNHFSLTDIFLYLPTFQVISFLSSWCSQSPYFFALGTRMLSAALHVQQTPGSQQLPGKQDHDSL